MLGRVSRRGLQSAFGRSYATDATVARYKEHGKPDAVVKLEKETLGALGQNQVLVKMLLAPINPADLNMVQGTYPILPSLPAVGGNEGLGQVVQVGSGVTDLKVNDYVMPAKPGFGTWRSHAVCQAEDLLRAPEAPSEQLKPEYLASLSINPATALRLLDDFVSLQKGDVIIQNAANSMVGTSVIQIANARGIKTINIIRNRPDHEQMVEKLKSYGAYIVCTEDYVNTPEFRRLVSDLPKPKLALNGTGGPIATEMARLLGENGTFVTYGAMARQPLTFPSSVFLFKNIQVKGFWLSKWLATHSRAERDKMYADLVGLVKANKLRLWVERHNLSNFAEALARSQQPYRERKVMLVLDK